MIITGAVIVGFVLGCAFFIAVEFFFDWLAERRKTPGLKQLERDLHE